LALLEDVTPSRGVFIALDGIVFPFQKLEREYRHGFGGDIEIIS